ncbi:MAG: molybdenum cofactor guanylyltransferase [Myxococcota bacterium]|nr:molybdenum cofactor guanylyltransferase [Myxococcota bacterium]
MRSAILAGGSASRFDGAPKGLERVGGERIVDRVIQSLESATGELPILIANAPEAEEWCPNLKVVGDAVFDCGSLGGVYTALVAGEGPVFVLAWDMPFVPSEMLTAMIDKLGDHDACVPASSGPNGGLQPLCAIYGQTCVNTIRKQIVDEDLRLTEIFGLVNSARLSSSEIEAFGNPDKIFFNVNAPADLAKAQEFLRGDPD